MAILHCWIGVVWLLPLTNELSVHFTLQEHSDETKKFFQSNFRHKLAWTMKQHDVSAARVINADETCVRLLPANTHGWSQAGSKVSQFCSSKAAITGTLRSPWMPRLRCICSSFSRAGRTRVCRIETVFPTTSAEIFSVRHPNTL